MTEEHASVTQINDKAVTPQSSQSSSPDLPTSLNPQLERQGFETEINLPSQGWENKEGVFTQINDLLHRSAQGIPTGTLLLDKYKVEHLLTAATGEATLYVCSYQGREYVAKVYRRAAAIKDSVIHALRAIDSPYVARLYETGSWQGFPFEILPYYAAGSLQGKTFSFSQLQQEIIPALNEGLKVLHDHDIIHKDLKPSNIMLCDDGHHVAIIDFGISSVREQGRTVLVTRTGMTPDYSAPETYNNLFLAESDYYSLGITIYELFCGHTPYGNVDPETIERYLAIQQVPMPDSFPARLKQLILGLTYRDITHRRETDNPNRRWTYDEVKRWCAGEDVPVPGQGTAVTLLGEDAVRIPPVTFMYKRYTDLGKYVLALASDWNNGKKRLYRSNLSTYFNKFNADYANICLDAEEALRHRHANEDVEFFRVIYRLYPGFRPFIWQSHRWADMKALGQELLQILQGKPQDLPQAAQLFLDFMARQLFSIREQIVHREQLDRVHEINAMETRCNNAVAAKDWSTVIRELYLLAYLYTEERELVTPFGRFADIDALVAYVRVKLQRGESIDEEAAFLIPAAEAGTGSGRSEGVHPAFAAWLIVQGRSDCLKA
ncbi:protein kinase domain-containing protein [uncultured Mitsuokella sp.]|uniref:protein kinase domain-containing protein n=1 Tax=uncultured Mitsuokella sp. TaxID=453120 RepID=UPI00261C50B3|nr:protein kinase [uncultured Mitsuokella sp.]